MTGFQRSVWIGLAMLAAASCGPENSIAQTLPASPQPVAASANDREALVRLEAEAIALSNAGRYREAEAKMAALLPIEQRVYGPYDPGVGNTHESRGWLLERVGDATAAEPHRRAALGVWQAGVDAVLVARAHVYLGANLMMQSRYAEAVAEMEPSVDVAQAAWGPDHIESIQADVLLSVALNGVGRRDDAVRVAGLAAARMTDPLEDANHLTLAVQLGDAYAALERPDLASAFFKRVCDIRSRPNSDHRADAAIPCYRLAMALEQTGDLVGAESAITVALAIVADTDMSGTGWEDGATLNASVDRARLLNLTGRKREQIPWLRKALELFRASDEQPPRTLGVMTSNLADVLDAPEESEEAFALYAEAVSALELAGPEAIRDLNSVRVDYADRLQNVGRFPEAQVQLNLAQAGFIASGEPADTPRWARLTSMRFYQLCGQADDLCASEEAELLAVALTAYETSRGASAADIAAALAREAAVEANRLNWDAVLVLRRRILTLRLEVGDETAIARERGYLGRALHEVGRQVEAYTVLSEARRDAVRLNLRDQAEAYLTMTSADAAILLERYEEADQLTIEAVDNARRWPSNTGLMVSVLKSRADYLSEQDRHTEAEVILFQALAILDGPGARNGPQQKISILASLSDVRAGQNDLPGAGRYLRAAVDQAFLADERNGRLTSNTLLKFANFLYNTRQIGRAIPIFEQAYEMRKTADGPTDPDALTAAVSLAEAYHSVGRNGEALELLRPVANAMQMLGSSHQTAIGALRLAGLVMADIGIMDEAIEMLGLAHRRLETTYGSDSPELISPLNEEAYVLFRNRQFAKSERLLRQSMRISEIQGGRSAGLVTIKTNLGRTVYLQGRPADALGLFREAGQIAIARRTLEGQIGLDRQELARDPFATLVEAAWAMSTADAVD